MMALPFRKWSRLIKNSDQRQGQVAASRNEFRDLPRLNQVLALMEERRSKFQHFYRQFDRFATGLNRSNPATVFQPKYITRCNGLPFREEKVTRESLAQAEGIEFD